MLGKGGQPFPPTSPDNNHSGEVAAKATILRKPWAAVTQLPTFDTLASPHFKCDVLTWPFEPWYWSAAQCGCSISYQMPFYLGTASPLWNSGSIVLNYAIPAHLRLSTENHMEFPSALVNVMSEKGKFRDMAFTVVQGYCVDWLLWPSG